MDSIYRELQRKIATTKSVQGGGVDMYSSPAFDAFLGAPDTLTKTARVQGTPEQMATLTDSMLEMLAVLRAQYWIFQNAHWQVRGDTFYGDHLLFQRLYEDVAGDVDSLAEKCVGYLGCETVDPSDLLQRAQKWVDEWCLIESPVQRTLAAERTFLGLAKHAYDILKGMNIMTLGLDDAIMAMCNSHEGHEYLLQQRLNLLGKAAKTKKASLRTDQVRISSLGDLAGFLRVSTDVLIRKCEKDLWKVTKDADGHDIIEKLYDGDILNY